MWGVGYALTAGGSMTGLKLRFLGLTTTVFLEMVLRLVLISLFLLVGLLFGVTDVLGLPAPTFDSLRVGFVVKDSGWRLVTSLLIMC